MDEKLKKVVAHHDWWSKRYDSDYFEQFDLYHKITMDNIQRFLPENKDALILDAGGGTGIFSVDLARMGYSVILTDISKGMLEKARKKVKGLGLENLVRILHCDIRSMPEFHDNHFDVVICEGDPLSYCGDHASAIKEFTRVVKPGGVLIASVDNRAYLLRELKKSSDRNAVEQLLETGEIDWKPQEDKKFSYTIHTFTEQELRELFKSNKLSVERIIGKLVIARRLPWYKSKDPKIQSWLYDLELKYNDNPAFYPWASHLEIVGRKM